MEPRLLPARSVSPGLAIKPSAIDPVTDPKSPPETATSHCSELNWFLVMVVTWAVDLERTKSEGVRLRISSVKVRRQTKALAAVCSVLGFSRTIDERPGAVKSTISGLMVVRELIRAELLALADSEYPPSASGPGMVKL